VKGPLTSIVVPVYNGEHFLAEALDSLFAQDYDPIEVIVVDDGSEDDSAAVARSFPLVTLVEQKNKGPGAARNTGIARATGEFIAIHDADDVVPPAKLAVQVAHLLKHPEIGCVLGRQHWLNAPPGVERDRLYGDLDGVPLSSAVFPSRVLRRLGGYDSRYRSHENMDLLFRIREIGLEVAVLPDVVLYRRYHGANLSFTSWPVRDPRLRSLKEKLDRERLRSESEM
jgi:glycosyltransferase involved in cell wall biosynthesis